MKIYKAKRFDFVIYILTGICAGLAIIACPAPDNKKDSTITVQQAVAFTNLTATGSETAAARLILYFDKDIAGLTVKDISLIAGVTGVIKDALTRVDTGIYELAISGITASGTVTVKVAKTGYTITPSSRMVTVYYGPPDTTTLTITFNQITDNAPSVTGPTLYRVSNGGPTGATLTLENHDQYDSISWRVQDTAVSGTGPSFTLSAANTAYNFIGEHLVTVSVMKEGVPYNKTVSFKIEY